MKYLIFIIIYVSSFCSCSAIKLAHSYADWYVNSEIDDAFDLNSKQEAVIEERVDNHLLWLDREFIPEIIRYTDLILLETSKDLTPQSIEELYKQFEFLRVMLVTQIANDAAWLFADLNADQKKHFNDYLAESNEDLNEQLQMSDKEFAATINKKRFENIEEWFGDLEDEQIEKIKSIWPPDKEKFAKWRDDRKTRHQAILSMVGKDTKKISAHFIKWAEDPGLMLAEDRQLARKQQRQENAALMMAVFKVFNEKQRIYFKKKIEKLRQDLSELVKK